MDAKMVSSGLTFDNLIGHLMKECRHGVFAPCVSAFDEVLRGHHEISELCESMSVLNDVPLARGRHLDQLMARIMDVEAEHGRIIDRIVAIYEQVTAPGVDRGSEEMFSRCEIAAAEVYAEVDELRKCKERVERMRDEFLAFLRCKGRGGK